MSSWMGTVAAWVAALIAVISVYVNWKLNRAISNRTVTIEAQKLLLEINKQYVNDPALLALEGDSTAKTLDPEAKLRGMAYFKLNVFEIIFAALADKTALEAWTRYFEDSLAKSDLLGEELDRHRDIYQRGLLDVYDRWKALHRKSRS